MTVPVLTLVLVVCALIATGIMLICIRLDKILQAIIYNTAQVIIGKKEGKYSYDNLESL